MCEEFAWGYIPHDLVAISSYWLGNKEQALKHGTIAVGLSPKDKRLRDNLKFYSSKD